MPFVKAFTCLKTKQNRYFGVKTLNIELRNSKKELQLCRLRYLSTLLMAHCLGHSKFKITFLFQI